MSSEQRPDSLAAQAAAWVPPWERHREPDREYQAEAEAEAETGTDEPDVEPGEGAGERGHDVAPIVAIDAPHEMPEDDDEEEPEPTDVEPEPELPLPESVEDAENEDGEDEDGEEGEAFPVDAPVHTGEAGAAEPTGVSAPAPAQRTVPAQARGERDDLDAVGDGFARTTAVLDDAELAAALESIMLVVDEPVGELQLAQVMEEPVERVARTLENISARYTAAGHGIDLRRAAGGWRLYTRPEYAAYVERFVLDGQSVRLTQAALETLSVVAYKQPVTRSRISAIRGVNCDGVMRTLVTRGLIEECGTEPETGAYLYRTTTLFLEKLGLNSVDQLPPLAPFLPDDVEEVLDASG
ncbi:SMC-Scp complex subunit ScpB [Actinoplanes aureus]|uniref:SMC-Scp complex subunit ScpB n=1 Tax=Actinoplanes aureus TaxID=2792083 RepID=A0A931CJK3_9ACTN|nr:SMC-Scp complex subunit ScpB [Actinoplanes aureus]MBG0567596.1 SMC-Scp complex subunit ScpB [Actinoplanes aureus]